ncbi:MAG: Na(+)-translocating NADH-quinone reductase subunit A [bacterium]|nr:Na(+)-translocating NADH-quinone reductase subunit A [bacterium]
MSTFHIKRGYNIPVKGEADVSGGLLEAPRPGHYTVHPLDFGDGLKPRLQVETGDSVKIGSPLFVDKAQPEVVFASPAAGKVSDIQYGPRRVIESITIQSSGDDAEQFENFRQGEIKNLARERLIEHLLSGGVWPYIRQRPFDIIASPGATPASIFVNCMDTAPLAADPEFALKDKFAEFEAGIEALQVLAANNTVHIVTNGRAKDSVFARAKGANVEQHTFTGKHPAGLVGTHISRIDPLVGGHGKVIWYLNARDVVMLGSFLLVGQYPTEKVVAVVGNGVNKRAYYRARVGQSAESIIGKNLAEGEQRIVSGNLLTGAKIQSGNALGFYDGTLTVLPEGRERHFIGWMLPGLARWTYSRAFVSAIMPGKKYAMHTNKNGEKRAFVKTGDYSKVISLDVLPDYLCKAILSEDIELMEQLGIMECSPEDFALCSYICPSKVEFTEIIKQGLDLMQAELA